MKRNSLRTVYNFFHAPLERETKIFINIHERRRKYLNYFFRPWLPLSLSDRVWRDVLSIERSYATVIIFPEETARIAGSRWPLPFGKYQRSFACLHGFRFVTRRDYPRHYSGCGHYVPDGISKEGTRPCLPHEFSNRSATFLSFIFIYRGYDSFDDKLTNSISYVTKRIFHFFKSIGKRF